MPESGNHVFFLSFLKVIEQQGDILALFGSAMNT